MDGITLAEKAQELRPDVRIAFMSGHTELDRRTVLAINERPFLVKPFRKYELAAALEALSVGGSAERNLHTPSIGLAT